MLELAGAPALSDFRLERLLASLRRTVPSIRSIRVRHRHFVDLARSPSAAEFAILERLLDHAPDAAAHAGGLQLLTVPRPGTISPWSSKATDIAHVCGLDFVRRIERGRLWHIESDPALTSAQLAAITPSMHDPMTEAVFPDLSAAARLFETHEPRPLAGIALGPAPKRALMRANVEFGLALSDPEIDYLAGVYARMGRDPTDVEVMMFAQANSEHCRHKIFNADWVIDGVVESQTLFAMIRHTRDRSPEGVLSAYSDNAAVIAGPGASRFFATADDRRYRWHDEAADILIKVETHNHPTAISPFSGASTGSGGEIRDEGATGLGAKPKAGLVGFTVSNLRIPGFLQPWEADHGRSPRIASALDIMLEGPIGAAAFNNEFGRPGILGYFRTFEMQLPSDPAGVAARLSQADHDRGRPRQRAAHARREGRGSGGRAAGADRRAGDADRPRRRRRVVAGQRCEQRAARFRVGAARQPGNAAARPGGHRPLLGDG